MSRRSDVRIFPGNGKRDADALLDAARCAGLVDVTIIGWKEGDDFFLSSSRNLNAEILWDLRQAEAELLGADDDDEG